MDNYRFLVVHKVWILFSPVMALSRAQAAAGIPSFPPCAHSFGAVVHKWSTDLCTREALPELRNGRQLRLGGRRDGAVRLAFFSAAASWGPAATRSW